MWQFARLSRLVFTLMLVGAMLCSGLPPVEAADCGSLAAGVGTVSGASSSSTSFVDTGAETTLSLTNFTGNVLVIASFESNNAGSSSITASYRLWDGSSASNTISRNISSNKDYGIGAVAHLFSYSSFTGSKTFKLQHKTDNSSRAVATSATLVAIPLVTSGGHSLNSAQVQPSAFTSSSTSYVPVTGSTVTVNLPVASGDVGDLFIVATFNSGTSSGGGGTAEWKIEHQAPGSSTWTTVGLPTQRTLSGTSDTGAVTLLALAPNQAPGDHKFRLSFKSLTSGKSTTTSNLTLAAVALAYNDTSAGYFPAFTTSASGVDLSGANSRQNALSATRPINSESAAKVFLGAQYQMDGTSGSTLLTLDVDVDGGSTYSSQDQRRLISNTGDIGNGGSVGLSGALSAGSSHSFDLRWEGDSTPAHLTNPVLVGIGMTCRTSYAANAVTLQQFSAKTGAPIPIAAASPLIILLMGGSALVYRRRLVRKRLP